jgi:hypothetical protein
MKIQKEGMTMTLSEKVSYIKGMMEGMSFEATSAEAKLLCKIVDLLEDMALSIEDLEDETAAIEEFTKEMDEDLSKFYISGVYFKENADVSNFEMYVDWLRKAAKDKVSSDDINYALFEILAEYKRCGVSKADVLKAMLKFNPVFTLREMLRRKQTAKKDIEKCVKVAASLKLRQVSGTKTFPIFEK